MNILIALLMWAAPFGAVAAVLYLAMNRGKPRK